MRARSAKGVRGSDAQLAVAYLRVSTDTERQALGAEAQRDSIERWASAGGVNVVAWYVEEVSGGASLDRRPVLLEALAAVAAHRASVLVVQRLDLFSRDPLTAALAESELRKSGASLVCSEGAGSGDDPTAEQVRGILFSVARFEKAMIRARIKAALAVKKRRRELTGVAPYGWRAGADGRTLEPHPEENAILDAVRALRASGLTIRGVQQEATARGLVGRTGKTFTLAAIHAMVKRPEPEAPE
jgi:DNA invertase Pin-like site-specific DNA recombinase